MILPFRRRLAAPSGSPCAIWDFVIGHWDLAPVHSRTIRESYGLEPRLDFRDDVSGGDAEVLE
jgi:hypothetical protein